MKKRKEGIDSERQQIREKKYMYDDKLEQIAVHISRTVTYEYGRKNP